MSEKLQTLPIGIQSFERLRKRGHLYVDKTARLMELVSSDRCFLSRPRRFGKSLTLSTLDTMFRGKVELFSRRRYAPKRRRPRPALLSRSTTCWPTSILTASLAQSASSPCLVSSARQSSSSGPKIAMPVVSA